jgi:hypothetical protein
LCFLIAVEQQYPISKYEFLHLWGNFTHDVWTVYKAIVLFFSFQIINERLQMDAFDTRWSQITDFKKAVIMFL